MEASLSTGVLPSPVTVACRTVHGGTAIAVTADFGLGLEISEGFAAPFSLLAPCCGLKLQWAEENVYCAGCGAWLSVPDSLPRSASRRELPTALTLWLQHFLDPMTAIVVAAPLEERLLTLHEAMEELSSLGHSREELGKKWDELCAVYAGSLFPEG